MPIPVVIKKTTLGKDVQQRELQYTGATQGSGVIRPVHLRMRTQGDAALRVHGSTSPVSVTGQQMRTRAVPCAGIQLRDKRGKQTELEDKEC